MAERSELAAAWAVAERLSRDNPFYAPRLGTLPAPADRTDAAFRTLPTTTKHDVVADCDAHPPYGRRTTALPSDIRHVVETSGTTGHGREVYALDAVDERAVFAAEAFGFRWAGVTRGTKVLLTLPVATSAAGLWYAGGLRMLGANVFSVGSYDTDRKIAVLRRYGADVVVGTPSYVQRLAAACEGAGVDPASLGVRALVVAGERYSLEWAKDIQDRWAATLFEQYGATERVMAWACPGGVTRDGGLGVLHFPPDLAYVECIDPDSGDPVPARARGELVTTPLVARASPLLRFATRDRVEYVPAGGCSCGRSLAGIRAGGVERYDDMVKVKGVNVWPSMFDSVVFDVAGVVDYRGVLTVGDDGSEHVTVTVETVAGADGPALAARVSAAIRQTVGLRVDVAAVSPGVITQSVPEGFTKISRWQDQRRLPKGTPR